MKRNWRNLVLWIAVVGSFTISVADPSLRLPAMFFVFIGVTIMILRRRRRDSGAPADRDPSAGA